MYGVSRNLLRDSGSGSGSGRKKARRGDADLFSFSGSDRKALTEVVLPR